jgi:phospholipid/cholesterol/gamma-HCH transport system substrate-binding protein
MDERVIKFRVGVMVLATLIIAGILILLFGDARSLVRSSYTLHMHFSDAPGVTEGTPIRKSGILIGRVTKVQFADQGGVNVAAKIDGNVVLYRNEVPQVSGSLLGGDVVIQFIRRGKLPPNERPPAETTSSPPETRTSATQPTATTRQIAMGAEKPEDRLRDGDYIEGSVAPNVFQVFSSMEGDLGTAITSLTNAGDEVGKLAARVNNLLEANDEQITRIVGKTEQTLDAFQRAMGHFDDLFGSDEVRENLRKSIEGLPELLTDTRSAMGTIRTTVESVDRNLRNLEGLTGPLGERGEEIVGRVDESVARLDDLLGVLSEFGRNLNSGEGSLGRIMRDPELYQHLNATARNLEQITCQLKPILADARVFSDKIARHPEVLGVRGAIQKSPGTK